MTSNDAVKNLAKMAGNYNEVNSGDIQEYPEIATALVDTGCTNFVIGWYHYPRIVCVALYNSASNLISRELLSSSGEFV